MQFCHHEEFLQMLLCFKKKKKKNLTSGRIIEAFKNAFLLISSRGRLLWLSACTKVDGKMCVLLSELSPDHFMVSLSGFRSDAHFGDYGPIRVTEEQEVETGGSSGPALWLAGTKGTKKKQTVSSYSCPHCHPPLIQKGHAPNNANFTFTVCKPFHHYMDYRLYPTEFCFLTHFSHITVATEARIGGCFIQPREMNSLSLYSKFTLVGEFFLSVQGCLPQLAMPREGWG